jgi:hypothetical protein
MRTALLIVVLLGLLFAAGGVLFLGAFPPQPHTHAVQEILPNDRFKTP